jgi:hypothetical protein
MAGRSFSLAGRASSMRKMESYRGEREREAALPGRAMENTASCACS